jgi:hypothetical protein
VFQAVALDLEVEGGCTCQVLRQRRPFFLERHHEVVLEFFEEVFRFELGLRRRGVFGREVDKVGEGIDGERVLLGGDGEFEEKLSAEGVLLSGLAGTLAVWGK